MATLLLRLAGPLQAWGTRSRFIRRDTEREPSKSGVIGLLCAALGRPRSDLVDDLAALRMGVRVDLEGTLRTDFHTAQYEGKKFPVVSQRDYLADADFLVGLQGDDEALLRKVAVALREPRWQLCLGRKAFAPAVPVWLPGGGWREDTLEQPVQSLFEALRAEPWPRPMLGADEAIRSETGRFVRPHEVPEMLSRLQRRFVLELRDRDVLPDGFDDTARDVRADEPVGAAFQDRSFGLRRVVTGFRSLATDSATVGAIPVRSDALDEPQGDN